LHQHALVGGNGRLVVTQAGGQHRVGETRIHVCRVVLDLLEQRAALGLHLLHLRFGNRRWQVVGLVLRVRATCGS